MILPDLKDYSLKELEASFIQIGEKPFRARQVFEWIYQKGVQDFAAMANLPVDLREKLEKIFPLKPLRLKEELLSADGTQKFLFELGDGELIESVLIPAKGRNTICVSTQAGCKFNCRFCASGLNGFKRNLKVSEILGQVLHVCNTYVQQKISRAGVPLSHVVFMGTGEPLDNYENLLKSIRIINAKEGLGIAARRITVSTCGLIPQIKRLAKEGLQIELSVSLHGFDDASRATLMPVGKKYLFSDVITACREYAQATKRQVTFEYILIRGVTATPDAPSKLAQALKGMLAKINLIAYNPIAALNYIPPSRQEILSFQEELTRRKIPVTLRLSRGQDIMAACGQLRHQHITPASSNT